MTTTQTDPSSLTESCDDCEASGNNRCSNCSYYKYRVAFRILAVIFGLELFSFILFGIFSFTLWTTSESSFLTYGNTYFIAEYTTAICGVGLLLLFASRNLLTRVISGMADKIRIAREEEEDEEGDNE